MITFPLNVYPSSAIDAGIKWRPTPSEVEELGPEFQEYWESRFANVPDKPILWMGIGSSCVFQPRMLLIVLISSRFVGDYTLVPRRKYYSMGVYTVSHLSSYPLSSSPVINAQHARFHGAQEYTLAHGFVHITHADDISAPPDFVPGYFESSVSLPRPSTI